MKTVRRKSRGAIRVDERKNRSDKPLQAATLYLEAVAGRCDARAVALSTQDGLVIAGTRGSKDLDGIAAIGAACIRGESESESVDRMMNEIAPGEDVYANDLTIAGIPFHLTSVGARVRSVKDTTAGLTRILGPALAPSEPTRLC